MEYRTARLAAASSYQLRGSFCVSTHPKYKGDPDFCDLLLDPTPPAAQRSNVLRCSLDFSNLIEKSPVPPQGDEFMNTLAEVFTDAEDNLDADLFEIFQADLAEVGDEFFGELVGAPGLVRAWEVLFSKQAWRTNTDYLTKVNRYADDGLEFFEDAGEIYVKQADGVIVGKLDPNDVYDPGQMKVLGESSGRHFDPDLAGGPIVKKSWANPTINQSGIDDVSTHVARFTDPEAIANNNFMINRLDEIKNGQRVPDDFDKRFYTHELEEYSRFENLGVVSGPHTEANYLNSHTASLEAYSINENVTKIYPPEVPFPQYAGY